MTQSVRLKGPSAPGKARFFDHDRQDRKILVSIIIPCYNEADGIRGTVDTLLRDLRTDFMHHYELIFVDDHSSDRTADILMELCAEHPSVKLVRLGSNCGSHVACRAGLEYSSGDVAIFLTADLQEGPELVPRVLQKWREGTDIVCTVAEGRDRGSLLSDSFAHLYYFGVSRSDRLKHLEDCRATPRLLDRKAVSYYCRYAPRNHNMTVWILQRRFQLAYVYYEPAPRRMGYSKWTIRKRIALAVNTFLDITSVFLTGWVGLGLVLLGLGLVATIGGGLTLFLKGGPTASAAMIRAAVICIAGLVGLATGGLMTAVGALGVYIWRIYDELATGRSLPCNASAKFDPTTRRSPSRRRRRSAPGDRTGSGPFATTS